MIIKEYKSNNPLKNYIHVFSKEMSCKIYPDIGASIQDLVIKNTEIIYGINSLTQPSDVYTVNPSILMFPFPGRVKNGSYIYKNKQYQLKQNEQHRDNAIHGLIAHKSFTLTHSASNENQVNLSFSYSVKNADKGFPYDFDIIMHYTIKEDQVNLDFEISNTGKEAFPFALGWHPYFKTNDLSNNTLSFKTSEEILCNENMIPTGTKKIGDFDDFKISNTHFDTCYVMNSHLITLKTQQYIAKINIENKNQQYVQLFTPALRDCIAIEPMSCIPDAFNNGKGLSELSPDCKHHYKIKLTVEIND